MKTDEFAFGPFRLDRGNALLRRGVDRVALTPKPFEVLCYFVERPGQLVTKDELMTAIWPDLHVSESSLTVAINSLRSVLGDDRSSPTYIETVTRRGYRFVGSVEIVRPVSHDRFVADDNSEVVDGRQAWVGREDALEIVNRALRSAQSGRRQVVFVTGEAGIGKTTLVEMALKSIAGESIGVVRCGCNEMFGAHEAFLPLIEGLQEVCGAATDKSVMKSLREHAPTWLAQMPWLLIEQERTEIQNEVFGANRERMLREFCDFMEDLASRRPWVIVLEDMHWSDPATVDALSRLARRDRHAPLMILATYRQTDVAIQNHPILNVHRDLRIHGRCLEASLDRLNLSEVERLLALRFSSGALSSAIAARVFARTEGQPLFVVALVDHLVAQGAIVNTDGEWRIADQSLQLEATLPGDIREMILQKVARLSAVERALLDAASAAGPTFSALLIAGAIERDVLEVEQICEDLANSVRILTVTGAAEWPDGAVSGEYAFIHALYQQVLYEQLSPARKSNAHRRLGESLERGQGARAIEFAPALALHFEQGRTFAKALHYLGAAAESSARRFSMREAAGYLTRALELLAMLPPQAQTEPRIRLLLQRAWAWRAGGEFVAALNDLNAMVTCAAEAGNVREEVSALVNLSRFQLYVDRRQCLEVAERAVARSLDIDNFAVKALAEGNLANLHLMLRPWRDIDAEVCVRAMELIDDSQDLSARARRHSMEMTLALLSSRYAECCAATLRGRELARAIGDVYLYVIYNFVESIALFYAGEWGRVRDLSTSALAIADRNFNAQASALCRLTIAWLHVEAQDFEGGARQAIDALNPSVEANPFSFFIGRIVLAKAYLGLHDLPSALEQINMMARRVEDERIPMETPIVPHFVLSQCDYWLEAGDLDKAQREADRLLALTVIAPDLQFVAYAHEAMARIALASGETEVAAAQLAKAIRLVRGGRFPLPAARIYATAADLFGERKRDAAAKALRSRGRNAIQSLADSLEPNDPLLPVLKAAGTRRG